MKRYHYMLTALALLCILAGSISGAISYFTTYAGAHGERTLHLVEETRIWEDVENNAKKLTVYNTDDNVAVYVRAKGFPEGDISYSSPGGNWVNGGDGFWYYCDENGNHKVLEPGQNTGEPLVVSISWKVDENTKPGQTFHVAVIYEAAPVTYNGDGSPVEDWNQKLIEMKSEGGN